MTAIQKVEAKLVERGATIEQRIRARDVMADLAMAAVICEEAFWNGTPYQPTPDAMKTVLVVAVLLRSK